LGAVKRSQALGDVTPVTEEDLWQRIAKDTSAKPYKALALDLVGKAKKQKERAISAGLEVHHRIENTAIQTPELAKTIMARFDIAAAREVFETHRANFEELLQRCQDAFRDAVQIAKDFLLQRTEPASQESPQEQAAAHVQSAEAPANTNKQEPVFTAAPSQAPEM
jgi:hypothetical protein